MINRNQYVVIDVARVRRRADRGGSVKLTWMNSPRPFSKEKLAGHFSKRVDDGRIVNNRGRQPKVFGKPVSRVFNAWWFFHVGPFRSFGFGVRQLMIALKGVIQKSGAYCSGEIARINTLSKRRHPVFHGRSHRLCARGSGHVDDCPGLGQIHIPKQVFNGSD